MWPVPCCNWRRGAVQSTLDWSTHSWTPRCVSFLALSAELRFRGYQSLPTSNHQLYEGKLPQTDWWWKPVLTRVGHYTMISPTHHNYACNPESVCGVSRNQLTSTVSGENPGSRPWWSMPTSWTTTQSNSRILLSLDNSGLSWTASVPDKVTAVPVRRNGISQTLTSVPAVRPKRCNALSNPAHWQDYTVACPNYTLQTMMPLLGWPVMALKCIRNNNCRRQNRNFMFDNLLHLLTWTQPDKDCLCRVQMLPAGTQRACDVSNAVYSWQYIPV